MASKVLKTRKDGSMFYEVNISRGRNLPRITKRIDIPKGMGLKAIESAKFQDKINREIAKLENAVEEGELISLKESKEEKKIIALKESQIPLVSAYANELLDEKAQTGITENTIEYYRFMIDKFIIPAIGNKKINEVVPEDIKKLLVKVQSNNSWSTARGCYIYLAQIFESAEEMEIILKSPVKKSFAPKKYKESTDNSRKSFTLNEIFDIQKALTNEPLKWQVIGNILIDTGMRRGELCALKWRSINWETGAILIDSNIVNTKVNGKLAVKEVLPKNGKARIVWADMSTIDLLNQYACTLGAYKNKDYIFTQVNSQLPITPGAITQYFRKFGIRYKLGDINPHKFRHTFSTIGHYANNALKSMSALSGHSEEVEAKIYVDTDPEQVYLAGQNLLDTLHQRKKQKKRKTDTKLTQRTYRKQYKAITSYNK